MEDPRIKLQDELKQAMREKNKRRRDVIRMAQSAIKQVEIDTRKVLSPEDVVSILQKEAKKRHESIADLEKAGRGDHTSNELEELAILEEFLPQQLSEEELVQIVKEVIAQVSADSPKDIGKVMGPVMQRVKGLADGKVVNQIVRDQLNS